MVGRAPLLNLRGSPSSLSESLKGGEEDATSVDKGNKSHSSSVLLKKLSEADATSTNSTSWLVLVLD